MELNEDSDISQISQADLIAGLEVSSILSSKTFPDFAAALHYEVIVLLQHAGFAVTPEFIVPSGRIDILCEKDKGIVAIELDCRQPRKKSISKLMEVNSLIGIKVHMANPAIKMDRRSVRRGQ